MPKTDCLKICGLCERIYGRCVRNLAQNDNEPIRTITVPRLEKFHSPIVHRRLATVIKSIDLSRRNTPDLMADLLYRVHIRFVNETRTPLTAPEIEEVLSSRDEGSWFSDLKKFADTGPLQRPQVRILPRLRLIYLMIVVGFEEISQDILLDDKQTA